MIQKASSVGNLAAGLLSRSKTGTVTRVFRKSAYVKSGEDFLLLLWGDLRSPMTINVQGGAATASIRAGEKCKLNGVGVSLDSGRIDVAGADIFRSALLDTRKVILPRPEALRKGVGVLRSLYDVTPSGPTLNRDRELKAFGESTLLSFASGESARVYSSASYLPLVGRGGGFTPAGDDFLGGMIATFNFIARCRKSKQIRIPRALLRGRTVPESANVLFHSARGHVDEGMERLVLRSLDGSTSFSDELIEVAHRGHTSGIDMSLGVLLCEAAVAGAASGQGVLEDCLDTLWRP
jgi:hypothetical protein